MSRVRVVFLVFFSLILRIDSASSVDDVTESNGVLKLK